MAKKAQIDLLDIDAAADKAPPLQGEVPGTSLSGSGVEGPVPERRTGRFLAWGRLFRMPALKALSVLAILILVIMTAGGSIWWVYDGQRKKEAGIKEREQLNQAAAAAAEKKAFFDDFVVNVRDQKGVMRIAFYGVAIELWNRGTADAAIERIDVRSAVHDILKRRPIADALTPEGRRLIKNELARELDRLLGERAVKNIYFTRVEVI